MLDHLTDTKLYTQVVSGLNLLTAQENLESHLQAFLLSCRVDELSPSTIVSYRYQLGRFVTFCIEANCVDVNQITSHHVRLFLLKLQETNNRTSVSDYRKSIHRFFQWMVDEGSLEKVPMQNIRPTRKEEKIPKPFSRQDIDNLLLLCSGTRFLNVRNRAIILVFLDTGLRLAELAGIQLVDIILDREIITVMGKGARERIVRIGKTAQKGLIKYLLLRNDTYPCLWVTEERKPMTAYGVQTTIKKLSQRAGVTDAKRGPHTFRHTFATSALRNGAGLREVQTLLGHKKIQTTLLYAATVNSEDAVKRHKDFSPVDRMFSSMKMNRRGYG